MVNRGLKKLVSNYVSSFLSLFHKNKLTKPMYMYQPQGLEEGPWKDLRQNTINLVIYISYVLPIRGCLRGLLVIRPEERGQKFPPSHSLRGSPQRPHRALGYPRNWPR